MWWASAYSLVLHMRSAPWRATCTGRACHLLGSTGMFLLSNGWYAIPCTGTIGQRHPNWSALAAATRTLRIMTRQTSLAWRRQAIAGGEVGAKSKETCGILKRSMGAQDAEPRAQTSGPLAATVVRRLSGNARRPGRWSGGSSFAVHRAACSCRCGQCFFGRAGADRLTGSLCAWPLPGRNGGAGARRR